MFLRRSNPLSNSKSRPVHLLPILYAVVLVSLESLIPTTENALTNIFKSLPARYGRIEPVINTSYFATYLQSSACPKFLTKGTAAIFESIACTKLLLNQNRGTPSA